MKKIVFLVLAIVLGIALIYNNWKHKAQQSPPIAVQQEKHTMPEKSEEPSNRFPIPEIQSETDDQDSDQETEQETEQVKPLPLLDQSDDDMQDLLAGLVGQEALMELFNVKDMIRHIVVTIDNLPRKQYALKYLPTRPVAGRFEVTGKEEHAVINTDNYLRYLPYVQLAESLDEKAVVKLYAQLYPLFQETYEDLGYPSDYFNDRLIDVIDHLLDTPDVKGSIQLVRPNVLYEYADQELEALSAGQKILIRMGYDNAHRIKVRLRALRNELTAPVSID